MPKNHRLYPAEFRQRIIELVRKGRTPEELGRQFEPSAQAIRNWVKQAGLDAGERTDDLTTEEREELRDYVCFGDILSTMKSRARSSLSSCEPRAS